MAIQAHHKLSSVQARYLPLWWRCVLIALATVILSACTEPVTRIHLAPDKSLEVPRAAKPTYGAPPVLPPGARMSPAQRATPSMSAEITPNGNAGATLPQPLANQPLLEQTFGDEPRLPQLMPQAAIPQAEMPVEGAGDGEICSDQTCGDQSACDSGCCTTDPYGPVVGPPDEYLCDGGDHITPAGVEANWKIDGLEPEDAIGHYDTLDGRVIVEPSNRVCIYAPRFAAVRRVVQPVADSQPVFINQTVEEQAPARANEAQLVVSQFQRHKVSVDLGQQPANLFRQRQQAGGLENLQASMDVLQSIAAYANLSIVRTGVISEAEKALVEKAKEAAITLTGDQAPQVVFGVQQAHAEVGVKQPGLIYQTDEPNHPKLRLLKLASCGHASPGDEIEFTLRYDNIGDQEIGNVTIVDNLTTRFEYVPQSAKSSVDADFITQANDAGSLILRWEVRDPVKAGDGGVLRFRVKVR